MSPKDTKNQQPPQKGDDDILTARESKLIDDALKLGYKPGLVASEHRKDLQREKEHPLGTPGSIQDRVKEDGYAAEGYALTQLEEEGKLDPEIITPLWGKKSEAFCDVQRLEEKEIKEGKPLSADDKKALDTARRQLESMDIKIAEIEDKTPMADTFRAARKVAEHGSNDRRSEMADKKGPRR